MTSHTHSRTSPQGFTLIELTVTMVVGLMIALISMMLFTHQLSMFNVLRDQNFMIREAPQVNSLLNRLISRSDALLVDPDNNKLTLTFIDPTDNSTTTSEIAFEEGNLIYKSTDSTWTISTQLKAVDYSYDHGVLLITLTGPNDGEIKHASTPL